LYLTRLRFRQLCSPIYRSLSSYTWNNISIAWISDFRQIFIYYLM